MISGRFFTGIPCLNGHIAERLRNGMNCVECNKLKQKRWRDNNRVKALASTRNYYAKNKEREKLRRNARAKNYPEERYTINRNRRARKKAAKGKHTKHDISMLFIKQKGKCAATWCNKKLRKYHVDHKLPLSRGGSNWPRNLQLLCPFCNDSKGAKTIREWVLTRCFKCV